MDAVSIAAAAAIALAVAIVLGVLFNAVRMTRIRLQPMRSWTLDLMEVPASARSLLDVGRRWLVPRGFRYLSSGCLRTLVVAKDNDELYYDLYLHPEHALFAVVQRRDQPLPGDLVAIEFQSILANGELVSTVNRHLHAVLWRPEGWQLFDDYLADMDEVMKAHLARVSELGTPASDPEARTRATRRIIERYLDSLIAAGKAARGDDGHARLRLGFAIGYVMRFLRGSSRAGRVKIRPLGEAAPTDAGALVPKETPAVAGIEADMQAYRLRRAALSAPAQSGKGRFALLSAVAFIGVGAWLWDWRFAIYLLVVIGFHEAGHYLAMKLVGYRNLNVFFVPGLGGLATGEKQDATVAQKVFVYLAGPVPGIALATAGLILLANGMAAPFEGVHEFLMILLVVNVLNLLPVTPLDGGRVLEVLLFTRWPMLRFAFALGCCLLLVAAGAFMSDTVLLVVGILVALSMPAQWRVANVARRINRGDGGAMDEGAAVRRVFGVLAQEPFSQWSFDKRVAAADELISELRTAVPGLVAVMAGLLLYAACFVAPAGAAVVASPGFRETVALLWDLREMAADIEADAPVKAAAPRDWNAELAAVRRGPADRHLTVLLDALEAGHPAEGGAIPEQLARVRSMADALPKGTPVRARAFLFAAGYDEQAGEPAKHREHLASLLAELDNPLTPEAIKVRAQLQASLAWAVESPQERITLLRAARDALLDRVEPGEMSLAAYWASLAGELQSADSQAAESEWRALLAWHGRVVAKDPLAQLRSRSARHGYLRFLLSTDRFTEAQALVMPVVTQALEEKAAGKRGQLTGHYPALQFLFWYEMSRNDVAAAQRWLDTWRQSVVPASLATKNPHFALAELALAEAKSDAAAVAASRKRLSELPSRKLGICQPNAPAVLGPALEARIAELVRRNAVCAASG